MGKNLKRSGATPKKRTSSLTPIPRTKYPRCRVCSYFHRKLVSGVDVVFDTAGGDTLERSFQVLKKGGFLVTTVAPPSREKTKEFGVQAAMVQLKPSGVQLKEVSHLIEEGKLKAHVETILPLSQVKKAHELSKTHHAGGKIVLRVAE